MLERIRTSLLLMMTPIIDKLKLWRRYRRSRAIVRLTEEMGGYEREYLESIEIGHTIKLKFPSWIPLRWQPVWHVIGRLDQHKVLAVQHHPATGEISSVQVAMPDASSGPYGKGTIWIDLPRKARHVPLS